ncbi:SMI1/KNR4 family protein [Rhodococcus opacus]|uniref:SMI1/KNR4 family protein n=1 Tax=Rhodococcus opacus TaxID=37919 RepID=UPI001F59F6FC|nr:SMI1/KNR4 family protein [Rhodococcus opacus]UNN02015.1 SMI1/KNR4 family protein [Rhodococcus opacus]UZG58940.1 SMI1/KNR4 family protein [Rhodococcus opacus]
MTVSAEWARIIRWCSRHAPVTARGIEPGASPDEIAAAETATGVTWPDDLREWYALQNGARFQDERTGIFPGSVFPLHVLLSLDQVLERRDDLLSLWRQMILSDPDFTGSDPFEIPESEPAGTTAWMFLPSFVPFTSQSGFLYFVDTRPGPRHGCVTEYAHADVDSRGPKWSGIATMLATHADSLESGTPLANFRPVVVDGALKWEVDVPPAVPKAPPPQRDREEDAEARLVKDEMRRRLMGGP